MLGFVSDVLTMIIIATCKGFTSSCLVLPRWSRGATRSTEPSPLLNSLNRFLFVNRHLNRLSKDYKKFVRAKY